MANFVLDVNGLTMRYNNQGPNALDNVVFTVEEGEVFGFLGPNGAGKSTLMRILTTLQKPTNGSGTICGYSLDQVAGVRSVIGYVAQELAVDQCLSGMENLMLQARFYRIPRQQARKQAEQLLTMVNLAHRANELVATYSGGMRKRLDIAVGLIHQPKVLFLDEPTVSLDTESREEVWRCLKLLTQTAGVTIVITTHYMEEADRFCDRIGIVDGGKIKALGCPQELKASVGKDSLTLDLIGDNKQLDRALHNTSNLTGVVSVSPGKAGTWMIRLKNPSKTVPLVIETIHNFGLSITNMQVDKASLNDVYFFYTGSTTGDSPGVPESSLGEQLLLGRVAR